MFSVSNPAGINRGMSTAPILSTGTWITSLIYLIGIGHMGKIARPTEVQLPAVNKA